MYAASGIRTSHKMKHYIIYRNKSSPDAYFACAESPRQALRNYALQTFATQDNAGNLKLNLPGKRPQVFSHELEAIECCEKAVAQEWSMQEVRAKDWMRPVADGFCGYNKFEVQNYIKFCREKFGDTDDLPKGAFVWYLKSGPLVTFFQPRRAGVIQPSDIKLRFLLPWVTYADVVRWSGDYDQLLSELSITWWEDK
jgi:hypothetical protein